MKDQLNDKHECNFIMGSCICGSMYVKRQLMTKREIKELVKPTPDSNGLDEQIDKELDYLKVRYTDWLTSPNPDKGKFDYSPHRNLFKAHIASQVSSAVVEAREPYNELIMAVGNKYAGETRHETALRYIRQAEAPTENTATLNVNTKELKDD